MSTLPAFTLSSQLPVPQLLARYPQTRSVLDRYGLKGCGGHTGPHETLEFFARMHGVSETTLLQEVQAAIASLSDRSTSAHDEHRERLLASAVKPAFEDVVYRSYFTAAILTVLTFGATWGAYLLWKIGLTGKFTGVSVHEVNAHGHAQIFGWVGLFVMGFALQAFPRMWQASLRWPSLARITLGSMLVGIVIRTIGMTAAGPAWALQWAMAGGVLEIGATLLFAVQISLTFAQSKARFEPYVGFVLGGLFWFVAQAIMCVWHTWNTMTAPTSADLVWYIATYQAPLRDMQIHGLALFMILGVSIRTFPALLGVRNASSSRQWTALAILTLAVIGECVLFVAYRWTHDLNLARMLLLPWLMLLVGSALIALPWRLWRRPDANTPASHMPAFARTAYAWLAVSLIMLILLPVYQFVSQIPFSHAYYGAIRHAITVGFISLMIMGMATKIVPTLNGIDPRQMNAVWGPFILVNVGCFLRVSLQTLSDWHPSFFYVVGISGLLEVAGLTWWGLLLIQIMRAGKRDQRQSGVAVSTPRPGFIAANHKVADVLAWYPQTESVFIDHGLTLIRNPLVRATVARTVTLAEAASHRSVPLDRLLNDLNLARLTTASVSDGSHAASSGQSCTGQCGSCSHAHDHAEQGHHAEAESVT